MSGFVEFGNAIGLLQTGDGDPRAISGGYVTRLVEPGGAEPIAADPSEPSGFVVYSVAEGGTGGLKGNYASLPPKIVACSDGKPRKLEVMETRGVIAGVPGKSVVLSAPQNKFAFEDYNANCLLAMSNTATSCVYAPRVTFVTINSSSGWNAGGYFEANLPTTAFSVGSYPALGWNAGNSSSFSGTQSLALVAFVVDPPSYNGFTFPVYCSATSVGDNVQLRVYPTDGELASAIALVVPVYTLSVRVFVSAMSGSASVV